MKPPKVTVLMPVYNGADFLRQAIDSILRQSYRDFELLVVNDGSTDSSREVLKSYSDPRLILAENERNLGLIATLNRGLELARGEFVARMDQDDISLPERLEVQQAYLGKHPEVGLLGSWYRPIGNWFTRVVRLPTNPDDIRVWMPFHCPLAHPTVMLRRKVFLDHGLYYDPDYLHAEDYELWSRASAITVIANIGRTLLDYRVHPSQITSRHATLQAANTDRVRARELRRLMPDASPDEVSFHCAVVRAEFPRDPGALSQVEAWLIRLNEANQRNRLLPAVNFRQALYKLWRSACLTCALSGWAFARFSRSPISGWTGNRPVTVASFAARALRRFVIRSLKKARSA